MSKLTLGSLFDGSGGFPLGALLCGIEPLWASEIEPFPIRVTTKRIPQMKHYGDINKLNGAELPPVDIITFGSPCTDMSVAGKRAGLDGEQSVLFYEAIRIIKEMRCKTNGQYPRYAVWENVPGAFSSNKGEDFKAVLETVISVKEPNTSVPLPEKGRWPYADIYMGDGWSVAYRTIDAQYFGVPQRRRRIYLVADFADGCAGEILFESEGLSRDFTPSGSPWQRTAGNAKNRSGKTGDSIICLNDQGGRVMSVSKDITATLRAEEHGHQPCVMQSSGFCTEHSAKSRSVGYEEERSPTLRTGVVPGAVMSFEPGAASRVGGHTDENLSGSLRANMGDNQTAVVIENHPTDSRVKLSEDNKIQTLTSRMGTGGGNVPLIMNTPKTLKIRSGCEGGGKGALIQDDKSATLGCNNDQTVFVPTAYGICSDKSNSMQSSNPHSGIYEADTSRTIDANGGNPGCNQGGIAVVALQGSMIGREDKNGPQGSGIDEEVSFTLNTADRHAVAYAMTTGAYAQVEEDKAPTLLSRDYKDAPVVTQPSYGIDRAAFNQGQNALYKPTIDEEQQPTLTAKGPGAVAQPASFYPQMKAESQCYRQDGTSNTIINGTNPGYQNGLVEPDYIVRRLTPTECARLQGFPDDWCDDLGTENPTEDEISFWTEVWETHRKIIGKSKKPKTRNQIIKWLNNPHSDSAEYKMWGNGVALPCVCFVLTGIVLSTQNTAD
ncbi:cytosine methyltransferase [Heyndrickxia shackletonii]|uniref:DNA (cytosine-5-)-methyltransferase n=1 Tax=Heyndrickxia shackletonii TaxID=157838 RepID=A0A0Q3WPE4_9BACI|nr:DNA cytosine methyltransferase [Heyndrickxia shackletonii]KQL50599.1 cytosine methyltransferase [Heyndrickxia shackletonii]NEY98091.1 DNA cytosine methyltransferase [Heyndrickxia shackletonii]